MLTEFIIYLVEFAFAVLAAAALIALVASLVIEHFQP